MAGVGAWLGGYGGGVIRWVCGDGGAWLGGCGRWLGVVRWVCGGR